MNIVTVHCTPPPPPLASPPPPQQVQVIIMTMSGSAADNSHFKVMHHESLHYIIDNIMYCFSGMAYKEFWGPQTKSRLCSTDHRRQIPPTRLDRHSATGYMTWYLRWVHSKHEAMLETILMQHALGSTSCVFQGLSNNLIVLFLV